MTRFELREKLDELGIKTTTRMSKAELASLYDQALVALEVVEGAPKKPKKAKAAPKPRKAKVIAEADDQSLGMNKATPMERAHTPKPEPVGDNAAIRCNLLRMHGSGCVYCSCFGNHCSLITQLHVIRETLQFLYSRPRG